MTGVANIVRLNDESLIGPLLELLENATALIAVYDQDDVLRFMSKRFRDAYYIEKHEALTYHDLMLRNYHAKRGTVIETDDIEAWLASVRSRRGKTQVRTCESDMHDGTVLHITETLVNGWILYVATDVTELNVSERNLRFNRDRLLKESLTDDLTGISNRRHVMTCLQTALDAQGEGYALLFDLDHFKQVNDTYGHDGGDKVLVAVTRAVSDCLELSMPFGRVGGEEFLVVLPSDCDVYRTLETVQRVVSDLRPLDCDPDFFATISGGLTEFQAGQEVADVLRRADLALYDAKAGGRKRIVIEGTKDELVLSPVLGHRRDSAN